MSSESSRAIRPSASATFRPLKDGGVLLDVKTGAYFEVNMSGRFIWETIVAGTTRNSLVESLASHFEINPEAAAADVDAFLLELEDRRLLVASAEADG